MSCVYCEQGSGKCWWWDAAQDEGTKCESDGCDEEGYCVCDSDPDPSDSCGRYESDGTAGDDEEEVDD